MGRWGDGEMGRSYRVLRSRLAVGHASRTRSFGFTESMTKGQSLSGSKGASH
ncbi:MAG: hypothetical protein F6K55_34165 [Moorea sp. SIO4A3]|nr:hypothetical protein [Moorena sp. SIO4A3]